MATILGTVQDETHAVVPGVTVQVKNVETGIVRTVITDERGRYRAPQLSLGTYEVRAELEGFSTEVRQGVQLTVGQEAVVNLLLRIGEISNTVTVSGTAELVQTQTSEIAGLVDQRQIRELPLNGRDVTQLVFLQPGVVSQRFALQSPNTGQGPRISAGGARLNYNNFLVDGTRKNEFGSSTPGSVAGVQLGVDAIREFRVLTHNYSSEYGQTAGAIITAVTRSGTNALNGNGFYFHRNGALDARNYFDSASKRPPFTRHQYGFSLGGPFVRDRTFFFGAYESLRERRGVTHTAFVPTQAARDGLLTNPRTGLPIRVDSRVKPLLNLWPLPNGADLGGGAGIYTFPFTEPKDENFATLRVDHHLSDTFSIFGRYQLSDAGRIDPRGAGVFQDVTSSRQQLVTVQGTQILSSTVVNTLGLGYNRAAPSLHSVANVSIDPSLSAIPGRNIPRLIVAASGSAAGAAGGAITEIGPRNLDGGRWETNSYQVRDDLNYSRGAHAVKVGFFLEMLEFRIVQSDLNGAMTFNSLGDLLEARPARFTIASDAIEGASPGRNWRQDIIGVYAQDDLRVADRFTLNLGLRWETASGHRDTEGRNSILPDPMASETTIAERMFDPKKLTFQPRLGFAWDVMGDGKNSLRGGVGVFHNLLVGRAESLGLVQNPPFGGGLQTNNPPLEASLAVRDVRRTGLPTPTGFPYTLSVPTMYHYNLNVEKELAGNAVLRAGYVGSLGRHLNTSRAGNTAIAQVLPDGRKFFPAGAPVRNPNFRDITWRNTDGNSVHHALETSVTRRVTDGLHFQVSYTFAKTIDDQSSTAGADNRQDPGSLLDPDIRTSDRGRSINDIRHNLVANVSYQVPLGTGRPSDPGGVVGMVFGDWMINGILTASSGVPFTPLVGFNVSRNRNTEAPDRPNLVSGRSGSAVLGTPERWFDPTAFELPMAGTFGTAPRNMLEGPGLFVLDLAMIKRIPFRGATRGPSLDVRLEFFNLLNRANFGLPQNSIFGPDGSFLPNVGRITNTSTTAREMQVGVKLSF